MDVAPVTDVAPVRLIDGRKKKEKGIHGRAGVSRSLSLR